MVPDRTYLTGLLFIVSVSPEDTTRRFRSTLEPSASCTRTCASRVKTSPPPPSTGVPDVIKPHHLPPFFSGITKPNLPPALLYLLRCAGNLISYLKLLSILLIVSGQNPFIFLGMDTPRAWNWTQDNKVHVPFRVVTIPKLGLTIPSINIMKPDIYDTIPEFYTIAQIEHVTINTILVYLSIMDPILPAGSYPAF